MKGGREERPFPLEGDTPVTPRCLGSTFWTGGLEPTHIPDLLSLTKSVHPHQLHPLALPKAWDPRALLAAGGLAGPGPPAVSLDPPGALERMPGHLLVSAPGSPDSGLSSLSEA